MRKLLSCCLIWVLFEEAIQTQKVSYAVLCGARTALVTVSAVQNSRPHDTPWVFAQEGRASILSISAPDRRARRSEYFHSSLVKDHQCIRPSSEVAGRGFYSLSGLDILRIKYWLHHCLQYSAENIKNLSDIPIPQICIDIKYSHDILSIYRYQMDISISSLLSN